LQTRLLPDLLEYPSAGRPVFMKPSLIEYVLDSGDRAACRDGQTADFWSEGTKFDDCNMKTTGGRRAVRGTFNQD
ncbi:hypothetical protein, partial [Burkholderia sp. BDU5]|uniref:hypothetical protein n=1 Tax=Burkholderia sp. BDU5 TaxID=1385590 RepID=UPI001E37A35E